MSRRTPSTSESPFAAIASSSVLKDNWPLIFRALLISITAFWIFIPSLHGDWLWDDIIYFSQNPLILDPQRVWKAWFAPGSFVEYYPLQETVQWIQWQLWHNDTFGYHLTNVVLHILNSLLVWRLLSKLGLKLAWLGGLIFAIHPTAVESVASIAELKNTLSLAPFLLAMCSWIDYEDTRKPKYYAWALGLFLSAMFCKITMSPFPCVMLIYAWYKRGKITWNDLLASAPFFLISLVLGAVTVWAGFYFADKQNLPPDVVPLHSFWEHIDCIGLTLSFYFSRSFLPVVPMPMYPQWPLDAHSLWQFLPWPVLAGLVSLLWIKRKSWGRPTLLGLSFFALFLAPFLGIISVSYMKCTWVMDHFLYIPIIGLIGLVVAALEDLQKRVPSPSLIRASAIAIMAATLGILAWESHAYSAIFTGEEPLFNYVLRHNPDAWAAHNNIGYVLAQQNRIPEAMAHFEAALRVKPDDAQSHINYGNALLQTGHPTEAQAQYEEALRLWPRSADAHAYLGDLCSKSGHLPEALDHLQKAADLNPTSASARISLGNAYFQSGQIPEAFAQYSQATTLDPNSALAHYNLGRVLRQSGRIPEAIVQYQAALTLNPDYAEAHNNLGTALYLSGDTPAAIHELQEALRLKPDYPDAQNNLLKLQQLQNAPPLSK